MVGTSFEISNLSKRHWDELVQGSAIAPEIAALNFQTLTDSEDILERLAASLLGSVGAHGQQYATVEVKKILQRYESVVRGGWWVSGVDPLGNWQLMQWGQLKPDFPRDGWQRDEHGNWEPTGKVIKYEAPAKEQPRALFLQAPNVDWRATLADKSILVVITEGAKKAAALLSLGIPAIALTGVDGWSVRDKDGVRQLLPELKLFAHPDRPIIFVFDSDTKPSAICRVTAAKRALAQALMGAGVRGRNIKIAKWSSELGKGIDDVIATHGSEAWVAIEADAQTYGEFRADGVRRVRDAKAGLFRLTKPPTLVIDQRYLPTVNLPAPGSILAIDSPMGTGKTEAIKHLKEQFFERYPDGYFDVPGYRNGLGRQTAKRIGSEHLHDIGAGEHTQLLIDDSQALNYCLDSLHRRVAAILRAIATETKVCWVLDECDAVIKHLLVGGTLGSRRQQIQSMFADVARAIISSGGYIICGEADLPELPLAFLQELTQAPITTIQNKHVPHQWAVLAPVPLSKEGNPAPTLMREAAFQGVVSKVCDRNFGPIFFGTDDQKLGELLDRTLADLGKTVWRVDGRTSEEPWVKEFLDNPNSYLAAAGAPDILICTTTAESGLSINDGWFIERILYGSHLEYRALLQLAGRVRGKSPLTVYAADSVRHSDDDPASFDYNEILKVWQQNASDSALSVGIQATATPEDAKSIRGAVDGDGELFHRYAARYQARANISGAALRANLLDTLKSHGHKVTELTAEISSEYREKYKEAVADLNADRAEIYAGTPADESVDWAKETLRSTSSTLHDRTKAEKILLLDDYPGLPVNNIDFIHDVLIKAGGSLLKAHTLSWLCQHPEVAKQIDLLSWQGQLRNPYIWLPTIKRKYIQVDALTSSGLLEVAELNIYQETTPAVVTAAEWAKAHAPYLNRLFRLTIKTSQTNIQIVNKLLKKIGYKSEIDHKEGARGDQVKIWKIANCQDCDRKSIWEALERKWAELIVAEKPNSEGDTAPVDSTCNRDNPCIQIESTAPKPPIDRGLPRGAIESHSSLIGRLWSATTSKALLAVCESESKRDLDEAWIQINQINPEKAMQLYGLLDTVAC